MDIFQKRRFHLLKKIKAPILLRTNPSGDHHGLSSYRQDPNFLYLTGCPEEGAVVLLNKKNVIFFVTKSAEMNETWTGKLPSFEEIKKKYRATKVLDIASMEKILPHLILGKEVYVNTVSNPLKQDSLDKALAKALREKRKKKINAVLETLRVRKDAEEIKKLQRAVEITKEAFLDVMKKAKQGLHEYEIEALLLYHYKRNAAILGYEIIAASGKNALVLHYTKNKDLLKKGELLLLDSGADFEHYTADVTRTFPVSGKFNAEQKELYTIVLEANKEAIKLIKPGVMFKDVHHKAINVLVDGLMKLGLLKGEKKQILQEKTYRRFFMHGTSHWLGLEVHDCQQCKKGILEEGMVLTVEPGLYIPDAKDIPPKYRGIGIRIEDDVLVTKTGHKVLTAKIPKEIKDIEKVMK